MSVEAWVVGIVTLIVTSVDLTLTVLSWRESRRTSRRSSD